MHSISLARCLFILTLNFCYAQECICQINLHQDYHLDGFINPMEVYDFAKKINSQGKELEPRGKKTHRLDSIGIWVRDAFALDFRKLGVRRILYSDTMQLHLGLGLNNDCTSNKCSFFKYKLDPINQKLVEYSDYSDWDGSQVQFDTLSPNNLIKLEYNSNGLLWKVIFRDKYLGSNLKDVRSENIYNYDERNNMIERVTFRRDSPQDAFRRTRGLIYHYDEKDNLESTVIYLANLSGSWNASDSTHYIYNNENQIINKSEYVPVTNSYAWKNYNHDYVYKEELLDKIVVQYLNDHGEIWPIEHELFYTHQLSGDIKRISGVLTEYESFNIPTHYYLFLNDDNILTEDVQYPVPFLNDNYEIGKKMILLEESTKYEEYDRFPLLVYNIRKEYFYSELDPSNIADIQKGFEVSVFPNPAKDFIILTLSGALGSYEFSISDLNGKIVLSNVVSDGSKVLVGKLNPGIYIYTIVDKMGNKTGGKLMIAH